MKWKTTVMGVFDEDAYFIRLPDDLLKEIGWKRNDLVKWILNDDGTISLIKVEK